MCCHCGDCYARVAVFVKEQLQPYKFLGRCCSACSSYGTIAMLPGAIEDLSYFQWNVPIEVALYQLQIELDFLSHPQHPHNKEYNQ